MAQGGGRATIILLAAKKTRPGDFIAVAARTGSIRAGFQPAAPFLPALLSHEAWHVVLPGFLCSPIPNPHPDIGEAAQNPSGGSGWCWEHALSPVSCSR